MGRGICIEDLLEIIKVEEFFHWDVFIDIRLNNLVWGYIEEGVFGEWDRSTLSNREFTLRSSGGVQTFKGVISEDGDYITVTWPDGVKRKFSRYR